jgi:hypothetical protein
MTDDSGVRVFRTLSLVLAGALGIAPLMPLHSRRHLRRQLLPALTHKLARRIHGH